jgi:hypothetical protein
MLGDRGQEVRGGEDLKVAVNLGIEPGAVDDHVGWRFQGHFVHREGVAQDVLRQAFQVGLPAPRPFPLPARQAGLGLRRDAVAGVELNPLCFQE